MKILITLFVLFFSSSAVADNISDFQIEGISIGDSALDYLDQKLILYEINKNKGSYRNLSTDYGEVIFPSKFENYDEISIFVKTSDNDYKIYAIYGINFIKDNIKCLKKAKDITKQVTTIFTEFSITETIDQHHNYPEDARVKIFNNNIYLSNDPNNSMGVAIQCYEFAGKEKNFLSVSIQTNEIINWFNNF